MNWMVASLACSSAAKKWHRLCRGDSGYGLKLPVPRGVWYGLSQMYRRTSLADPIPWIIPASMLCQHRVFIACSKQCVVVAFSNTLWTTSFNHSKTLKHSRPPCLKTVPKGVKYLKYVAYHVLKSVCLGSRFLSDSSMIVEIPFQCKPISPYLQGPNGHMTKWYRHYSDKTTSRRRLTL